MGKRYYVEVTGLGGDGLEQLRSAGVAPGAILVIGGSGRDEALLRAIFDVTRKTMEDIRSHESSRYVVAARTIYIHFALVAGDSISTISDETNVSRKRLAWYRREYDNKLAGDREFAAMVAKVERTLESDEEWSSEEFAPQPSRRKKAKNGRARKTKRGRTRKKR